MALTDLFNETFTIKRNQGSNKYGRDSAKVNGDSGSCRLAPADGQLARDPDGEDVVLDALVYLVSSVTVDENDDIEVGGVLYRILQKKVHSRATQEHHIRLGVRKVV